MVHLPFFRILSEIGPKITLIGMSGLGKSHWSEMLEKAGYKRFCCDNLIADQLLNACDDPDGKVGCLGRWMGFPSSLEYHEKERAYLRAETQVLRNIIAYLETAGLEEKIVLDTTGSAPYAGEAVMGRLGEMTHMVHLATSPAIVDEMRDRYIRSPRPVVWGGLYRKRASESDMDALARCYKSLLAYRETLYRKYAHRTIPYDLHRI